MNYIDCVAIVDLPVNDRTQDVIQVYDQYALKDSIWNIKKKFRKNWEPFLGWRDLYDSLIEYCSQIYSLYKTPSSIWIRPLKNYSGWSGSLKKNTCDHNFWFAVPKTMECYRFSKVAEYNFPDRTIYRTPKPERFSNHPARSSVHVPFILLKNMRSMDFCWYDLSADNVRKVCVVSFEEIEYLERLILVVEKINQSSFVDLKKANCLEIVDNSMKDQFNKNLIYLDKNGNFLKYKMHYTMEKNTSKEPSTTAKDKSKTNSNPKIVIQWSWFAESLNVNSDVEIDVLYRQIRKELNDSTNYFKYIDAHHYYERSYTERVSKGGFGRA